MSALAGLLHLVALVLVVSGAQKVARPLPAAQAMGAAGLPVPARAHRLAGTALGVVEAATGLAVFAWPHAAAAAWLAAFYVALAGFVLLLRSRDATASCGCFGASNTPPTVLHAVLNVAAATVAVGAAAVGVPDVVDVVDAGIGVAAPYTVLVALGAGLVLLAPTLLADIESTVQGQGVRAFSLRRSGPPGAA